MDLADACKLVCNDIGMSLNSEHALDILKELCVSETLSKFSCDVINANWNSLWKQFIVKFVSGYYCSLV